MDHWPPPVYQPPPPPSGLLTHRGRIEEGGTARAAPARTGQRPACCATATVPWASRGRGPLAAPRLSASSSAVWPPPTPHTGTHAPGDRTADYAPLSAPSVILVLDTGTHGGTTPPTLAPCEPSRPPPPPRDIRSYPQRPHLPIMPVERPPKPPGSLAPPRPPDLRVNVAKCRRMSHFFIPPLGECRTLRVKNLTFLAKTGPF